MKKCPECGRENPDNAKYCSFCGHEFKEVICKICGHPNPPDEKFCRKCGNPLQEGPVVISKRYKLLKMIGFGGFGKTYLAEDLQLFGKKVVLKEFTGHAAKDRDFFKKEGMILAKLNHPLIPKIHGFFKDSEGRTYLVQDYAEGKNLRQILLEKHKLPEREVIIVVKSVLDILSYLEKLDPPLIHRDIKPENIILGENDRIFLVDFGAVKEYMPSSPEKEIVIYTTGYAAPEQKAGNTHITSDLYSLGVVAIELITGLPSKKFRNEETGKIDYSVLSDVTPEFKEFVVKLTAQKPPSRFKNADEALKFVEILEKMQTLREVAIDPIKGSIRDKEVKKIIQMGEKLGISKEFLKKIIDEEIKRRKHREYAKSSSSTSKASTLRTRLTKLSSLQVGTNIKLVGRLKAHPVAVQKAIFSPKGDYMITAGKDGIMKIFDTREWRRLIAIRGVPDDDLITDLHISPNSKFIGISTREGLLKFWQMGTWALAKSIAAHTEEIEDFVFSRNSKLVISGGTDNLIFVWNIDTWKKVTSLREHTAWILSLDYSPHGDILVTGGMDSQVIVWDTKNWSILKKFKAHEGWVRFVKFSSSGKFLFSLGTDRFLNIWSFPDFGTRAKIKIEAKGDFTGMDICPDEEEVYITAGDHLYIYNIHTGEKSGEMDLQTKATGITFFPKRYYFITSDSEGFVKLWKKVIS